jgi:membrane protease YdiL (CAAX protease family)
MTTPGWYDDPRDPAAIRWWDGSAWTAHTAHRPLTAPGYGPPPGYRPPLLPLDASVAALRASDPEPWGVRPVLLPLLTYVVLIVAGSIASATIAPSHGNGARVFEVVANVALEGILAAAVYRAGRDVARRNGGWGPAFGLRRPSWRDVLPGLAGIGIAFAARIAIGVVASVLTHGAALKQSENIHIKSASVFTAILLVAVVVIAAPIVEETVFRGLLLRTFLRRMSFWPAALLSTAIFGLGHTYEVSTLTGAVTLALIVGSLGLTNCLLNRYTDRLMPGMIVHASFNAFAVLFLLLGHSR